MKYCEKCKKEMDAEMDKCPVCGGELVETLSDEDAATIAATTTLLM
jgi:rRNA maturation endonuclease Nob1